MSVIEERRNAYLKLTVFLLFGVWWGTVVKAQVEDYTFTTNTDNTICIVMYRGFGGDVVVPDYINGMPVTSIGDHAFEGYWPMTSVVLPSNLTRIGINAFAQCSTLTTITIPGSVTWMGFQAFASCYGLTNITMGTNIVSMESAIFGFCYGLTRVKISDGVTMIGSKMFMGCTNLTSVMITKSVTSIADRAFGMCINLEAVYFMGDAPSYSPGWYCDETVFDLSGKVVSYYQSTGMGWGETFAGRPAVLWDPRLAEGGKLGVGTNGFGFVISGSSNLVVVVEACTNLVSPSWVPIGTNILSDGTSVFADPQWTNNPVRYYRISAP